MARKLLVLFVMAVALAGPASASAMGEPAGVISSMELRSHDAGPSATTADSSATSAWRAGAVGAVAIIILGTFAFALWSERQRPDDSGPDGGGSSRGDPDRPRSPTGPGAEDLHWSLFEAEFWDYVRSGESSRAPAAS
jgi:hypothetical protein